MVEKDNKEIICDQCGRPIASGDEVIIHAELPQRICWDCELESSKVPLDVRVILDGGD